MTGAGLRPSDEETHNRIFEANSIHNGFADAIANVFVSHRPRNGNVIPKLSLIVVGSLRYGDHVHMRPDGRDESMSDTIYGPIVDMLSRPHIFRVAYVRP
jgi:hypothetical protein